MKNNTKSKSASAKKTVAKKSVKKSVNKTAKKTAAKKSVAKKTPTKKSVAKTTKKSSKTSSSAKKTVAKTVKKTEQKNQSQSIGGIMASTMSRYASRFAAVALAIAITASLIFSGTGCRSVPSSDTVRNLSGAVGVSAGYVCELTNMDDKVRMGIIEVLSIVTDVVPAENVTFNKTWTPRIDEEIQKLVDAKKLDTAGAVLVKSSLTTAAMGIDYIFIVHPSWSQYKDLVAASVHGFCDGYESVIRPINDASALKASATRFATYGDIDAFVYLKRAVETNK